MNWPWKRRTEAPEPMPAVPFVPEKPESIPEQPGPEIVSYPPFDERPTHCTKCNGFAGAPLVRYVAESRLPSEFLLSACAWLPENIDPEHLNWLCPVCGALMGQTQPANVRLDGTTA